MTDAGMLTNLVCFVLSVVILFVYLLPTWVAVMTKHPSTCALGFVNVFFGWTVIGWGICLVWGVYDTKVSWVVTRGGKVLD